jgi:hypothetical protein
MPSQSSLKELVWKPVMLAYTGKTSTTQLLKNKEIDDIVDIIRVMFSDMGIEIPLFPSEEEQSLKETYK